MDISSFIDEFEQKGASLSRPVLPENNYRGRLVDITFRANKVTFKTGKRAGQEGVLANFGAVITLDSVTAQQVMKQDTDVTVYADSDTENCKKLLNLSDEIGIDFQNNVNFWLFVGGLFSQVGLATKVQDDSGAATYKIERNILEDIYEGTEQVAANYRESEDFDEMMLPAKLAEHQIKNLSQLVTSEADTSRVYVHIARRGNYKDKSLREHYVKKIMLPSEFEARADNMASVAE